MAPPPRPPPAAAAEEEEALTLLVLAGVTSLARAQSLVESLVSTTGRERGPAPDLILALGPFTLEERRTRAKEKESAQLPPWRAALLDKRTVEGVAAAGAFLS